jgi:hypothetical protein
MDLSKLLDIKVSSINEQLNKVNENTFEFRQYLLNIKSVNDKKSDEDEKNKYCRGCSFKNPIDNCWSFHNLYPEKKSGFYWVNPKCS